MAFKGSGDTSHTVTGLTHGLTYSYRIRSYRTLGGSTDYSGYSYAEDAVPTATPTATATPPLACPSISDRSYQVGASVTLSLPAATGGDGTLTYSLDGLPAGLSSSGSPPVVSGTPATAGTNTVTYQAEDTDGDTCEEEFDITITEAPTPPPGGTPAPTLPLPPVVPNFKATGTFNGMSLTWTGLTGIQGYEVSYVSLEGGMPIGPSGDAEDLGAEATSYTFPLTCDQTGSMRFKIKARGDGVTHKDAYGPTAHYDVMRDPCLTASVSGRNDRSTPYPFESVGFQSDWWVFESTKLTVWVRGSNLADYEFNLLTWPSRTGAYVDGGIDGCPPYRSYSGHKVATGWEHTIGNARPLQNIAGQERGTFTVEVIRCELGAVSETGLVLQVRRKLNHDDWTSITMPGRVSQAPHQPNRSATYLVQRGEAGKDTDVDTLRVGTQAGVAAWHDRISWAYFAPTTSSPSVTIQYFEYGDHIEKCGAGALYPFPLACATDGDGFPHFEKGRVIWVSLPPVEGGEWKIHESKIEDGFFEKYLPEIMAHELGHVLGLDHLPVSFDAVMREAHDYQNLVPIPTNHDLYGFRIVDAEHSH